MTSEDPAMRQELGAVVIGRNEGERLVECLASMAHRVAALVYVDSGSTDGSVEHARSRGVEVVELDPSVPFTAARARNVGVRRLQQIMPTVRFVQVVDGDCEVADGWLEAAHHRLRAESDVAIVCGRRRERHPDASIYNRLCDMEWNTPIGERASCGGDALIRLGAFDQVGGYTPALIAGEEPEMCLRMHRLGWRILRIDHDMTWHDANMRRFGQWWKRMVRCGYAYAEGRALHGRGGERFRVAETRSVIEWGALLPLLTVALVWGTWGASLALLAGYGVLWRRIRAHRLAGGDGPADASRYALFCVLAKFPQAVGIATYWRNRLCRRRARLIEYKGAGDGRARAKAA